MYIWCALQYFHNLIFTGTTEAIEVTIVAAMIAMTDLNTTTVMTDTIALMTSTIAMNGPDLVHILPVSKKKKKKDLSACYCVSVWETFCR